MILVVYLASPWDFSSGNIQVAVLFFSELRKPQKKQQWLVHPSLVVARVKKKTFSARYYTIYSIEITSTENPQKK